MTKEEAAEALGVAPRTVERYAAQGLLHPKYQKGARGKIADFSEREVKSLKKQLSIAAAQKPAAAPKPLTAPFYHKLTLSVEEAAALAGLSKGFLEQAIEEGTLKVVKKDGKLNIKRKDLEEFIEKL
ncbi:MAG: helix-turn-helix domain-containing protein [Blastocatellia bacterium]